MQIKLSPDDIETIIREADTAARRLRRRLQLQTCDREDLGQDLLVDLLRRLHAYDPSRGSITGRSFWVNLPNALTCNSKLSEDLGLNGS